MTKQYKLQPDSYLQLSLNIHPVFGTTTWLPAVTIKHYSRTGRNNMKLMKAGIKYSSCSVIAIVSLRQFSLNINPVLLEQSDSNKLLSLSILPVFIQQSW